MWLWRWGLDWLWSHLLRLFQWQLLLQLLSLHGILLTGDRLLLRLLLDPSLFCNPFPMIVQFQSILIVRWN